MDPVTWIAVMVVVLGGWYVVDLGRRELRDVEEIAADGSAAEEVDDPDPPRGAPLIDEAARLGFERVTSLRQPIGPVVMISTLAVSRDGIVLGVSWAEEPGAPPPALGFHSPLAGGHGALSTQTLGNLPTADDELRQVFPEGDLGTLLDRHRQGLAWLAARGIEPTPVTAESAVGVFRKWTVRSGRAVEGARWTTGVGIWWRQRTGRHLDVGALSEQPGIERRIAALAGGDAARRGDRPG